MKTDNDESGGQEDGWESKVTLSAGQLQSLLFESECKLRKTTHTPHRQSKTALKEERGVAAVLPSQVEVTKPRKPIKKMINIHVGDAASTCRWDGLTIISHTYIMRAVNSAVRPVVTVVSWEVEIRRLI